MLNDGFVCYESQMLRSWAAFAGYAHTKENYQKPMKLNKIQINSLAILTTREPYALEKDRFVFGVFIVDEAYEGDNREQGYVTTSSKYKLSLSLDDAKKFFSGIIIIMIMLRKSSMVARVAQIYYELTGSLYFKGYCKN